MKKMIELIDGNKIIINISPGYCTDVVNISKGYLKDNDLVKGIELSIWDDISIRGYTYENNDQNALELEFFSYDPIYFCLNRLLDNSDEIMIDDDDTYGILEKYMVIKRFKNCIKIIFINKTQESKSFDKYGIFVKNIGPDPRSKIEDFNIKIRLIKFFRDMEHVLLEESHQITFDEYIEILRLNSLDKDEQDSKVLRK